jgi:PhnB protein
MRASGDRRNRPFVPAGWPRVVPRLFTHDPRGLVAFVKRVFRATGTYRNDRPSELRIGDSIIMVNDDSARGVSSAFLYVYTADTDAAYRRAMSAGARSIETPTDQPYGDRRAMVEDAWGNTWQLATHIAPATASRRPSRARVRRSSRKRRPSA